MSDSGLILLSLLTGAAATDIFRGRIPNLWILPAAVTGFLIRAAGAVYVPVTAVSASGMGVSQAWSAADATRSAAAMPQLRTYALLIPGLFLAYGIRALGAGDVKLLLTSALFLSAEGFSRLVAASFVIFAVFGALALVTERRRGIRIPFAPSVLIAYLAFL